MAERVGRALSASSGFFASFAMTTAQLNSCLLLPVVRRKAGQAGPTGDPRLKLTPPGRPSRELLGYSSNRVVELRILLLLLLLAHLLLAPALKSSMAAHAREIGNEKYRARQGREGFGGLASGLFWAFWVSLSGVPCGFLGPQRLQPLH